MSSVLNGRKVSKRSDLALDLSPDQWALAEDLVKVLKPFEVATTVLSAELQHFIVVCSSRHEGSGEEGGASYQRH